MTRKYNPRGYKKDKPILEKIIFCAPEYLVYETRMGAWISLRLQKILSWINEFSTKRIPKTKDSIQRKIIESITDLISAFLSWINYFIEEKDIEGRRRRRRRRR